jgi:predicted N-acetyltransferase YhbS
LSLQTEHLVVEALRRRHALVVSLVAVEDGKVVGHVAFSRVRLEDADGEWYGLAPLAVQRDRQRQGIGSALVRAGLVKIRGLGAAGCVLLGDAGYYGRFGFRPWPGLGSEGTPDDHVLGLPFGRFSPSGLVHYHSAFFEAG